MSESFQSYFDKAELALAAYSDFSGLPRGADGLFAPDAVSAKLSEVPGGKTVSDFSATEAAKFASRFDVLDQYTADPLFNGFSATVFREKATGQIYFVNRGTNDFVDIAVTDATLALGGKPLGQIVEMVNYYLRVKAGANNMAQQIGVSPSSGVAELVKFQLIEPVRGVGLGIGDAQVAVAGHSLGGYLSTVFGYLFGTTTSSVNTYNAPGSWGVDVTMRNLAALLGNTNPSYASNRQTNLIGDYLVSAVPGHRGDYHATDFYRHL